jgi:DNA replication and repair protein RecF
MYLKKLSLINFKNIREENLEFRPGINCFVGDNGAGKTNVIDAVYFLSMCKSSLAMTDGQSMRHGSDFFLLDGQYLTDGGRSESVVCAFARKGGKTLKRNGKEYERLSDHVGLIPVVIVSPADTMLISDAADERRRYLNGFISQLDRAYLQALVRYNAVLGERNRLLKISRDEQMLCIYDRQLVEQGGIIHRKRSEIAALLEPEVARYYRHLSSDREQVTLEYRSELNDTPFEELLLKSREKDFVNGFTTAGIHRDDLVLRIGGYPLRKYGSQGQQKSFLIALKLAQYALVAQAKGEKPILLLDDLFDKLDAGRVEQLIRLVSEDSFGQIMITDCNPTRLRTILDKAGGEYALFTVGNGAVTQGNATATAAAADPDKGSAGNQPGNAATDKAAEPEEDKTQGQTGSAAAERTEGQAGESPAGEPARRPSEPVPAPEPAEEPAAEPDGNGARPGDAASEGGRP